MWLRSSLKLCFVLFKGKISIAECSRLAYLCFSLLGSYSGGKRSGLQNGEVAPRVVGSEPPFEIASSCGSVQISGCVL